MKIAINGFGRIGKTFLRTILSSNALSKITPSVINVGPCQTDNLDILFKHDTIMGTLPNKVEFKNQHLCIDDIKIKVISEVDPTKIDWNGIDWVVESSGCFTDGKNAVSHIKSGANKVLISAPAKNEDITIIPGVNDNDYNDDHKIVSLGSCTTNCFAPMVKVIKDNFDLTKCFMTTTHSYTNTQMLLDIEHSDPRRARAAALNIIPTTTGAQKVITKIFPELDGKISASAIRVPTAIVSLIELTFESASKISVDEINNAFQKAANGSMRDIVEYTDKPLVSSDYIGNPRSCIIDGLLTSTVDNMGKVLGWYDNEWAYSMRLLDFLLHNS